MKDYEIDTSGLSRGAVLAALYNAAAPVGMGFLQYDKEPMAEAEANEIIAEEEARTGEAASFDYLKGRPMKITIREGSIDPRWYDRDQGGPGTAARIIELLREEGDTNHPLFKAIHQGKVIASARRSREMLQEHSREETEADGTRTLILGLGDAADILAPKLDEAENSFTPGGGEFSGGGASGSWEEPKNEVITLTEPVEVPETIIDTSPSESSSYESSSSDSSSSDSSSSDSSSGSDSGGGDSGGGDSGGGGSSD
jgi:hypothetical protein